MDKDGEARRIVEICCRLYEKNMLAGADGNISVRLESDEVMITPSGVSKAGLKPEDLVLIDMDGNTLAGTKPSSEKWMHVEVYRRCKRARAVIHAHPPVAVAWSVARPDLKELPPNCLAELIPATGGVPIVPYARPGSPEMAERIRPYLPECQAMILSHHGALTWGESLGEALNGMERIEHSATILKHAQELGGLNPLAPEEVAQLRELRRGIGARLL